MAKTLKQESNPPNHRQRRTKWRICVTKSDARTRRQTAWNKKLSMVLKDQNIQDSRSCVLIDIRKRLFISRRLIDFLINKFSERELGILNNLKKLKLD